VSRKPCKEHEQSELKRRARQRRQRIVVHRAASFEEAELWDLEYWQRRTPEERLSALVALRAEVERVNRARESVEE